ncbi:zinc finger protein 62 [Fopius arisanus]|uniref:Zinc finger protein 62 n=3 Tax=Fopius arisanus TaxID=64838 RepID=A0A9R1T073_9HYME|nr:PREDICTED: zinc finger protein 62-like [Fopius arisanus]
MDSNITEDVCRLCANRGKRYHSIFDLESNSIAVKINNCLPIEIRQNDKLPSHICSACLEALDISDKLRAQSLVADELLRQQLKLILIDNIKQEKDVDDDSQQIDTTERLYCGICEINFYSMTDFDDHMTASHSSQWICNLCYEDCQTSEDLLRHKYKEHYGIVDQNKETETDLPKEDDVHSPEKATTDDQGEAEESDGSANISDHYVNVNEAIDIKDEDPQNSQGIEVHAQSSKRKNIVCTVCGVEIATEELMSLHVKMHEPRQISCQTCFREFSSPYDLFIHKQNVHKVFIDQKMKWFCEKCERFTASVQFLRRHKFCAKIKQKCKYCGQEFLKKSELQIHQNKNHYEDVMKDPESEKFECETCGKSYVQKANYNSHIRHHQAIDEGKFTCPTCDKKFRTSTILKSHIEMLHEKKLKYICDICSKRFWGSRSMQEHRKRHANQTCQECGEKFDNTRILATHLLKQHNISVPHAGKFSCKICGKKFLKLRLLQDHKNTHTGTRPHVCDMCQKTFRTYAAKWAHEQRHKNEGFVCDYCKHKFTDKNNLRRHITRHLPPEEWRYQCEICDLKFQRHSNLQRHVERHKAIHPYPCNICEFRFPSKRTMTAHRNQSHREILGFDRLPCV